MVWQYKKRRTAPHLNASIRSSSTDAAAPNAAAYPAITSEYTPLTQVADEQSNHALKLPYGASDSVNSSSSIASREPARVLVKDHSIDSLGIVKSIGNLGSMAIAVNSLAGPAILQLPFQYQESGLVPTTICLVLVAIISCLCSLHMANVMSKMPRNQYFDQSYEFSDPFLRFWSRGAYQTTQVLFFLCTVCLNVAAIVDTAEVVDSVLGLHAHTYGFNLGTGTVQAWSHAPCTRRQVKLGECEPFDDETQYGTYLLTLGYLVTAAVFLPVCLMDLKENAMTQVVGFVVLLISSVYFCIVFATTGAGHHGSLLHSHYASVWGHNWSGMLGVIMFNFSLVLAVPSWLHEKHPDVSVHGVIVGSTVLSTCLYVLVGGLGAMALPKVNVNMLQPMVSGAYGTGMQVMGSIFAFFIIGLDIPLFSVLTRYNLTHSGMCTNLVANVMVVWIPWAVSWLLYQGDAVGKLLDWGGVLLTSAVAFLLPLYLALRVWKASPAMGSLHVYGCAISAQANICMLYALLVVASAAVVVAIGGQIYAQQARRDYLHSETYLSGIWSNTDTTNLAFPGVS